MWRRLNLFPYFKKKPLVGLDISADEIRLLQLEKTPSGFHIEKIRVQPLQTETIDNVKMTHWHRVKSLLTHMAVEEKLTGCLAAIAIPDTQVHRKQIQLPVHLEQEKLADEIKSRLMEYFPGIHQRELQWDFTIKATKNEMYHILLLAVRKAHSQAYQEAVMQSGFNVNIIDVDLYARARAGSWFLSQHPIGQDEVSVLVDLQEARATFMVFQESALIFHYCWQLNEEVAPFLSDLKKAWHLTVAAFPKLKLGLIVLSGNRVELEERIEEMFSVKVCYLSPLQGMSHDPSIAAEIINKIFPDFLLCCGLAMREPLR